MTDEKEEKAANKLNEMAAKMQEILKKYPPKMINTGKAMEKGWLKVRGKKYRYWILKSPLWEREEKGEHDRLPASTQRLLTGMAGYNGYVMFPKRPVQEPKYGGILTYVPVHGGITYAFEAKNGRMVYGFDTAHHNSSEFPYRSKDWIRRQIAVMTEGILVAQENEDGYLRAGDNNEEKAVFAQRVLDVGLPMHRENFGVNINLLFGKL